jgi:hypothetical protein
MTKAKRRVRVSRSAKSGEFVPEKFAETHPTTTVQETLLGISHAPSALHHVGDGQYKSGDGRFILVWDGDNDQWLIYKNGNTEPEAPKF